MIGWILLALFGVIVLVFFIPVRIRVEYLEEWRVRVWLFGVIPVWSFPPSAKKKDTPANPKSTTSTREKDKSSLKGEIQALFREEGVGGVMSFFAKLVRLLQTTLSSLARYITVRKLALCVRVGGEQADEIATQYGKLSAASAASLTVLSRLIRIKRPCIRLIPDFTSDKLETRLRMLVWVWPFGVLGVSLAAAWRFLMIWIKTMKTPQSGVVNTINQPGAK